MTGNDNIHSGHRGRMLDKFSENGIKVFSEHEILEVLLYFMLPRVNTNDIAHDLINSFGSLKTVLSSPVGELTRVNGIGDKTARQLRFVGALIKHINRSQAAAYNRRIAAENIVELCSGLFNDKIDESISLVLLDEKSTFLNTHKIISGKPENAVVDYRGLVERIMSYNCRRVVIVQKRDGGRSTPADDDFRFTREIDEVLSGIDVGIVDHIIISNGNAFSMRRYSMLIDIWED